MLSLGYDPLRSAEVIPLQQSRTEFREHVGLSGDFHQAADWHTAHVRRPGARILWRVREVQGDRPW